MEVEPRQLASEQKNHTSTRKITEALEQRAVVYFYIIDWDAACRDTSRSDDTWWAATLLQVADGKTSQHLPPQNSEEEKPSLSALFHDVDARWRIEKPHAGEDWRYMKQVLEKVTGNSLPE